MGISHHSSHESDKSEARVGRTDLGGESVYRHDGAVNAFAPGRFATGSQTSNKIVQRVWRINCDLSHHAKPVTWEPGNRATRAPRSLQRSRPSKA
jgi:hypothetical protein